MWLPKFLRKKTEPPVSIDKDVKCCKSCHTKESDTWYGEEIKGKWHYWCGKCYMAKFIADIHRSPQALAKYWSIYGKSPEEVLNKSQS